MDLKAWSVVLDVTDHILTEQGYNQIMLCILQDEGTRRSTQVQRTWFARERVEETSAHCGCKFI